MMKFKKNSKKDFGLQRLVSLMSDANPRGKLGILYKEASREDGELTNAEIGRIHEFGLGNNPQRSFLRQPIIDHMDKELEQSGAFDEKAMEQCIKEGSLDNWMKKVLIVGEKVVLKAFDTGGYGQWESSNMDKKKNHQTLVETQQLRRSISSEVES